jgi:hypothetical protein
MLIKICSDAICAALNAMGGYHWLWMRRFLMPITIGVIVSYITKTYWLGALCLPACGTLCIGYSGRGNAWRGFWLFLQAMALSLGLALLHHIAWMLFIPYVVIAGLLGGIYRNWPQILGDAVNGFFLSTVIWIVH